MKYTENDLFRELSKWITRYYGKPCPYYAKGCPVCDSWKQFRDWKEIMNLEREFRKRKGNSTAKANSFTREGKPIRKVLGGASPPVPIKKVNE